MIDLLSHRPARMDELEAVVANLAEVSPSKEELTHRFTPGLYIREIFVPAGTLVVTKIHKTEHPFVISQGRVSIWTETGGVERFQAPHCGITKPGTRRLIYHHEDTVLTTFHVTKENDINEIERQIIEPHDNPFLLTKAQMRELTQ